MLDEGKAQNAASPLPLIIGNEQIIGRKQVCTMQL
jgi:hypothetical protein